ncbi:BirA family transcriptional regulator, biotin operon repressor / biotin-[acetyl-CoA-carboxylase] ligase [Alkalispirochaeta americana]|uniref:BirA family transcriptional regulator, biotin operon repressor / biotin-[acetyl-CoA-carboxylase] ligase n=1 Tax=Alkalispirochaeta americana TaxID=159291 RepID=A0A1N6VAG7_9SPIO|nr:biotin--[acetyl-CoA-carboxylase] ligase [Alkalispirochaeta americana]SIQ74719.1 BirA family transcriptional regulator, biotin operon repressor / biotin-[acetyl-CoA-carboxylase] ligase [Alkalispirochaeta americana]
MSLQTLREYYYGEVDSTMTRAREIGAELPPGIGGFWVRAGHQTAGRGRRGKRWEDCSGSALMVTLAVERGGPWDPGDPLPGTLALRAAAAVQESLGFFLSPSELSIKWPNDILARGRKICGILTEADRRWFLIGIGINIHGAPQVQAEPRATSLGEMVERSGCIWSGKALTEALFPRLRRHLAEHLGGERWFSVVEQALAWRDSLVVAGEHCGVLSGIDSDGALLLKIHEGPSRMVQKIYSGTVRLKR